jgi:hypothetical protein
MLTKLMNRKQAWQFVPRPVVDWVATLPQSKQDQLADILKENTPEEIAQALIGRYNAAHPNNNPPTPPPAPTQAVPAPRYASRTKKSKTGFKIKMPKPIVLFAAGTIVLLIVIGVVLIANKPTPTPIGAKAAVPVAEVLAPEADPAAAEAAAPEAAIDDSRSIVAPDLPNIRQAVSFGSSPFKSAQQWVQLLSVFGLIGTLYIDATMKSKMASVGAIQKGAVSKFMFFAAPISSLLGVASIALADILYKSVSMDARYDIAGGIGILLMFVGWMASGFDKSHLGSSLGLLGMIYLVYAKAPLPFGLEGAPEVYVLKDTVAAVSLNMLVVATRSVLIYTLMGVGAFLVSVNILTGDSGSQLANVSLWGLGTALVIAGSLFFIGKFTNPAWGILMIVIAFAVNLALDPDGADEGASAGIIIGTLMLVLFGTPLA